MSFHSILYNASNEISNKESVAVPEFFSDLNLDQLVDHITADKQKYNLTPFYFSPLHDKKAIHYRQEIFRDLENNSLFIKIKAFSGKMEEVRQNLKMFSELHYQYNREAWFLNAVYEFCDAVGRFAQYLSTINLASSGLIYFVDYINNFTNSLKFQALFSDSKNLKTKLSSVQYNVIIKDLLVRVQKYEGEIDYSKEVEKTFEKFKQGEVKNFLVYLRSNSRMDRVETQVLDCVAKLFPEIFEALDQFCVENANFLDEKICSFDREIQFYIAYKEFISNFSDAKVGFCYPQILTQNKHIKAVGAFDLALAYKSNSSGSSIVCNGFFLKGKERIIVVSGPNQGGKTTFARMFGQLHYLASLGCPVPGKEAQLFLFDKVFTHFEKEEQIQNLRGKLKDDLMRIKHVLDDATSDSIIIINEIFTSTTLKDAVFLCKQVLAKIIELDSICVCVTFIDEISTMGEKTISMMSTIVPGDPAKRTFKIVRKPADGLSYAICIAEKHHLTYELLKERIL